MSRARIYIAGPISKGDVEQNVRNACAVARELIKAGYAPFCPQLTCYMQGPVASLSAGFDHQTWMEVDLPFVRVCSALLRLPGESAGADIEVKHAIEWNVPVYYLMHDLFNDIPPQVEVEQKKPAGDARFHETLRQMGKLHDKKQQDYGTDNDPFANIRSSESWGVPAWQGAMIRAGDKVKRLQSFAKNGSLANEGVEDSLLDLANYAVIALVLYREAEMRKAESKSGPLKAAS